MATADYPVVCPQCGYIAWTKAVIDRKRQADDPERKAYYKLDRHGKRIFRTYERKGFGAYCVVGTSGVASLGVLRVPVTRRVIAQFRRDVAQDGVNEAACWLTRWTGNQVEFVVGADPRTMMNSTPGPNHSMRNSER